MDPEILNQMNSARIESRQVDELIGLANGLLADGQLNDDEVRFLAGWMQVNYQISENPLIRTLFRRVTEMLSDGVIDDDERHELVETLQALGHREVEHGELLRASTLPLCNPAPVVEFAERAFCFTGTFNFGDRRTCEYAVVERGGSAGSLTKKTHFLVVGAYATDSWKHSSFGNKILKAAEMRDGGHPIHIVSEVHWAEHL